MGQEIRNGTRMGIDVCTLIQSFFPRLFDLSLIKQPHMDFVLFKSDCIESWQMCPPLQKSTKGFDDWLYLTALKEFIVLGSLGDTGSSEGQCGVDKEGKQGEGYEHCKMKLF